MQIAVYTLAVKVIEFFILSSSFVLLILLLMTIYKDNKI